MILAGGLLPLDLDVLDARMRRPAVAPAHDALHRRAWPLEDRFDPPIVEVAHPALDAASTRLFAGVRAKINPLYPTVDQDVRSDALHSFSIASYHYFLVVLGTSIIAQSRASDK